MHVCTCTSARAHVHVHTCSCTPGSAPPVWLPVNRPQRAHYVGPRGRLRRPPLRGPPFGRPFGPPKAARCKTPLTLGPPKGAVGLLKKIHGFLGISWTMAFLGSWMSWKTLISLENLGFLGRFGHENWGFALYKLNESMTRPATPDDQNRLQTPFFDAPEPPIFGPFLAILAISRPQRLL